MLLSSTRKDWLGNVRGDVLAGIVVALALIPEAIAFSIIACEELRDLILPGT